MLPQVHLDSPTESFYAITTSESDRPFYDVKRIMVTQNAFCNISSLVVIEKAGQCQIIFELYRLVWYSDACIIRVFLWFAIIALSSIFLTPHLNRCVLFDLSKAEPLIQRKGTFIYAKDMTLIRINFGLLHSD